MYNKIILFFIISIVLGACKKYPEDDAISFKKAEKRVKGSYKIDFIRIDGYDSTNYYKNIWEQMCNNNFEFHFRLSGGFSGLEIFASERKPPYNPICFQYHGYWDLRQHKNILITRLFGGDDVWGPLRARYVSWEIRKLYKNEFWIETNYNGKNWFVKLKK